MAFVPTVPPSSAIGHAEKIETSIMMALMPDVVDVRTLPARDAPLRYRDYGIVDGKTFDGYPTPDFTLRSESDPRDASGELGEGILAAEVDHLVETIQRHVQSMR
jgi:creatinine amidohydrolase/Fe(II)-dependent formamide hydrolase-like protein